MFKKIIIGIVVVLVLLFGYSFVKGWNLQRNIEAFRGEGMDYYKNNENSFVGICDSTAFSNVERKISSAQCQENQDGFAVTFDSGAKVTACRPAFTGLNEQGNKGVAIACVLLPADLGNLIR